MMTISKFFMANIIFVIYVFGLWVSQKKHQNDRNHGEGTYSVQMGADI